LREQTAGVSKLFFQDISGFFWLQKKWSGIYKTPHLSKSSTWNKNTKGRLQAALCVLSGECVFGEASGFFYITVGADAKRTGAALKL
jgi:hypothetical protein